MAGRKPARHRGGARPRIWDARAVVIDFSDEFRPVVANNESRRAVTPPRRHSPLAPRVIMRSLAPPPSPRVASARLASSSSSRRAPPPPPRAAAAASLAEIAVDAVSRRAARGVFARCRRERTDAFRLVHGVSEGAPGVTIDRYGDALYVQSWREPIAEAELRDIAEAARAGRLSDDGGESFTSLWYQPRTKRALAWGPDDAGRSRDDAIARGGRYALDGGGEFAPGDDRAGRRGEEEEEEEEENDNDENDDPAAFAFSELGLRYDFVPPRRFGDPSLFLDFRPTRRWVRDKVSEIVSERNADAENAAAAPKPVSVLNAFAYTCGVGVAAASAGASRVLNTDHSETYLRYGARNAALNDVAAATQSLCEDFYPAARQLAGLSTPGRRRKSDFGRGGRGRGDKRRLKKSAPIKPESFDLVILDPPTLTKTSYGAVDIENDYQSLAKPAALCVSPGGVLVATNHSAKVGLDDWLEIVRKCATKAGCEVAGVEVIAPEADDDDHPAMEDGKRPLKVAAFYIE
jgi:23S rRNA (cytosine1962-C5)-methyltransferase